MARSVVQIVDGWPTVDVGRLLHAITIWQEKTANPAEFDAAGTKTSWDAVTSAMASIEIVRGTDVIRGGQTTAQLFLEIVMWYQDGISPNMHITTENGSTYIVQSVENVLERNVALRLNCVGLGANT